MLLSETARNPNVAYPELTERERFFQIQGGSQRGGLLAHQALAEIFHCQG